MMVRYLEQEEKAGSRGLWEQCFPEDSAEFAEYYYREKCRDNQILALEEAEGEICAMVQRNPYQVFAGKRQYRLDYIVGVATAPKWRRQGCMGRLLLRMLADQNRERMPFTFLMPADPAIYRPFGFEYVYDQPFWRLNLKGRKLCRIRAEDEEQAAAAGAWLEEWLEKRYQVFTRRDRAYMVRLFRETASENGLWEFLYDGGRMAGMECFWGKEKRERRFLYGEEEFLEEEKAPVPAIMARIVNLEAFMENISLRKGAGVKERIFSIGIQDPQIRANNGLFSWRAAGGGSVISRKKEEIPAGAWTVPVSQLTRWLMGYGSLKDLAENSGGRLPSGLEEIQPLSGVFLDEIV